MNAQLDFNLDPWLPPGFKYSSLTIEERQVYGALRAHQGRENAIKAQHLAHIIAMPERTVRRACKSLTESHGVAIASSVSEPFGFYLVVNPDELLAYVGSLTSRGISDLTRAAALKRMSLPQYLGQISMKLEAIE